MSPHSDRATRARRCKRCRALIARRMWKCCPSHTTERGLDVMCEPCARTLHPPSEPVGDTAKRQDASDVRSDAFESNRTSAKRQDARDPGANARTVESGHAKSGPGDASTSPGPDGMEVPT